MMNKKDLFYFVGGCLALDEQPGFRNEVIRLASTIDWEEFVRLCSNHLILPAIFRRFEQHQLLSYLPNDLVEHLHEVYVLNVERNEAILAQVEKIVALLNEHGIKPTFLKGVAHLLDCVYDDLGDRMMSDIDFLVDEASYLPAAEILLNAGYLQDRPVSSYSKVEELKHYPRLFHPHYVASVEVHRIPVDAEFASWFSSSQVRGEQVEVKSLDGCFVPSDRHKIVHNFIHSQLSNEGDLFGRISLRAAFDLLLLAKRFPLPETLPLIKKKQKAVAYFSLVNKLLLGEGSKHFNPGFASWWLKNKHALNLKSDLFRRVFSHTIFLGQRILKGYLLQIFKAFYLKESRSYIFKRLVDRKWYGDHARLYSRFFRREV
ncbi:nucleotidyltransferase family protein [Sunxiuqinia elliptica]|nr:nucleotidyltransferase family protein [Sunxiuqinia elliptica]